MAHIPSWTKKLLLLAGTILSLILITEIILRIFTSGFEAFFYTNTKKSWDHPETCLNVAIMQSSKTLQYEWKPSAQNSWYKVNSFGMVDKERQKQKPQGTYRIICIGDSTTVCLDWVCLLEERLNNNASGQKYEAWNCGVPGYNTLQECRALREKWLYYKPDLVIIGFCLNDFSVTPLIVRENDSLVGYYPDKEIISEVNPFLFRHSALYRTVIMGYYMKKMPPESMDTLNLTRNYMKETNEMLKKEGVGLLVVIFGLAEHYDKYAEHWKKSYANIRKILDDYNIPMLDTVPVFDKVQNPDNLRKNPLDYLHFNKQGSEIVAQLIAAYMDNMNR